MISFIFGGGVDTIGTRKINKIVHHRGNKPLLFHLWFLSLKLMVNRPHTQSPPWSWIILFLFFISSFSVFCLLFWFMCNCNILIFSLCHILHNTNLKLSLNVVLLWNTGEINRVRPLKTIQIKEYQNGISHEHASSEDGVASTYCSTSAQVPIAAL